MKQRPNGKRGPAFAAGGTVAQVNRELLGLSLEATERTLRHLQEQLFTEDGQLQDGFTIMDVVQYRQLEQEWTQSMLLREMADRMALSGMQLSPKENAALSGLIGKG
tara:strand:+ start:792 stop:1112 length:321 start_codon:yes stop_codon:yes gene_type:complete